MPTSAVVKVEPGGKRACTMGLAEGGGLTATLIITAHGRNSVARAATRLPTHTWAYDQAAIAATFSHTRAHGAITTELHRRAGGFTTVPLPGNKSSLVWVERPAEARRLMGLDDRSFLAELEERLHGLLGTLGDPSPRRLSPSPASQPSASPRAAIALVGRIRRTSFRRSARRD